MKEFSVVGKSPRRVDGLEKVTGKAVFCTDVKLPGMLHVKVLRSPHPHARIIHINTAKAEQLPGVKCVITGDDVTDNRYGSMVRDATVLAKGVVRAVGEPVVAVAAETIEAAEEGLELIDIEYEQLTAVFDPEEAASTNPPVIIHPDLHNYEPASSFFDLGKRLSRDRPNVNMHFKIRRGDIEKGFQEADLVMENRFTTARIQHCPLELQASVVNPEADGSITLWVSLTMMHPARTEFSRLFNLPVDKVRAIQPYVGGSFGRSSTRSELPIAMAIALKTGKPVKHVFTREELFYRAGNRIPFTIYIKDGVKKDGTLVARQMEIFLGGGGSAEFTVALVTRNCAFGAAGTYRIPNCKLDSYGVYTNNPIATGFRGLGTPEVTFAIESHMDMLAEKLGIDKFEIRRKNILKEGEPNITGELTHSIGAEKCLGKIADWVSTKERQGQGSDGPWRRGIGIALANKYTLAPSTASARVEILKDGDVALFHGAEEVGQGCDTAMVQIAAEELGFPVDRVKSMTNDTAHTPFDSGAYSSRQTYWSGNAVKLACQDAKQKIFEKAKQIFGVSSEELETREGSVFVKGKPDKKMRIAEICEGFDDGKIIGNGTMVQEFAPEDPETGQIDPKLAAEGKRLNTSYAHTAKAVEVAVDTETGEVKVTKCATADDMGFPINPAMCEQQAQGGLGMGIGIGIYEEIQLKDGVIMNPNFTDYRMPTFCEMPANENLEVMFAPVPHKDGPFGAKGFSEGALAGMEPAIGNAIYDAVGVRLKDLPFSPERVLEAIKQKG
ncbi:MAG TPA: xanthine dehydrogenase family protein molybdopterin-binding subunit [Desulfatiglandales bacterium]|nr:xanthine dehydrogenase family protein molybdopterin-binding subunit [Desulfatiglandales bacterium]